ncbi:tetratricopeptide repeat protein [Streptomyces galbus]|uniref:ATP-binding protein n=1 Tax=Streptomyces galbus TaxID=33898 RepID=A0A4U5WZC7_STRGB|nr:ATP-binding protein [Streptomyces galbus]TKT07700.1 ATP-binding protein [Streptomyces galbus]GHD41099.1 ATPase AAA [Streptomyces galbus]
MDPTRRGPEEYGRDAEDRAPRPRPSRDPLTPDFGQHAASPARVVRLVAGEHLVTVNPVDGSEIELRPPTELPGRPARRTPAARAEADRAARPPAPAGPDRPAPPLLGRQDEREQLVRLLARGRSVRLVGPAGSGRTRMLDLLAEDCADLAPDGVVRLSGFRRTAADLLHDLFHAVYDAPEYRPDPDELLASVRDVGAVVVVDDLDFGGAALDDLLDATPECAFLFGASPDTPAPTADSDVEEVVLPGLDRSGGVDLIERSVGRALTEEEANWAGDLWFESEGLPLRFVQAGALLRQRDLLRASAEAVDEYGVFEDARPLAAEAGESAGPGLPDLSGDGAGEEIPLPSLGEAAAPAPLLASRLSASARATLRFAVALGGEVPHQAHLPALVGDTHADAALGELAACGLVSPVGTRYRLAAGVLTQLEAAGYADDGTETAHSAARHYAWWAGHPSVTPDRVCAEADAVLAALAATAPAATGPAEDETCVPVELARTAAPAFAAGLNWSAWEKALRSGAEAARLSGAVADQAYFHHELGVLALCEGQLDRARAELESSIGLRGALADKRGTVAGRRALALVADRSGDVPGVASLLAPDASDTLPEQPVTPPRGVPAAFPALAAPTLVTHRQSGTAPTPAAHRRGGLRGLAKRNLVAAGAGALLVAVLGTVVTLGATSDNDAHHPSDRVGVNPSATTGLDDGNPGTDTPGDDTGTGDTGLATSRPTDPGPDGTLGTSDDPTPTGTTEPTPGTNSPSGTHDTPTPSASHSTSRPPSGHPSTSSPSTPTGTPSGSSTPPTNTPSDSGTPTGSPTSNTSATAGGAVTSVPTASSGSSGSAPEDGAGTPSPAGSSGSGEPVI